MRRGIRLSYNFRSIRQRVWTNALTAMSIALGVWASVVALALLAGLRATLSESADLLNLVILRQGARTEVESFITHGVAREIDTLSGLARDGLGGRLLSPELVTVVNAQRRGGGSANFIVRGVTPEARFLRPNFRVVEGRDFQPGAREIVVSRRMSERFVGLGLGESLPLRRGSYKVVGLFESDGAVQSEIWGDLGVLSQDQSRSEGVSVVRVRAEDEQALSSLEQTIATDKRMSLKPVREQKYYSEQAADSGGVAVAGMAIATILTIGSVFAVTNTMQGAIAARTREFGTLRALGYSRFAIVASCIAESIILSCIGGAIGCLAALPMDGVGTGTVNWATLSEMAFAFRIDRTVLCTGFALATFAGFVGGALPALIATRLPVAEALRKF